MTLAARVDLSPSRPLADPSRRDLAHIPGDDGWPLIGNTLQVLADPKGFIERMAKAHGPVLRNQILGHQRVTLLGPEANEFVLFDRARLFSSELGWTPMLGRLFPRGLMLMDFDEHRLHRKALSAAFKAEPLKAYLAGLNTGIARRVAGWTAKPGEMRFYPEAKELTLDLAATCFFGRDLGSDAEPMKRAFVDMVAAIVGVVRAPLPGTQMARGVRGRAFMVDFLRREIGKRRGGAGEDLFSELCRTTMEDGRPLSDQEIVDHMRFLMMAAHDTLTSSLTSLVWFLATNPKWQARLREEVAGLGLAPGEPLPYERLDDLPLTEMAFKEALRLMPPVPSLARRLLRETEFGGFKLPEGTWIGVNLLYTHRMPDIWPEPDVFDPLRFTDAAVRERHKFAWAPYGGGAHMCLGLNFAYMQAKTFAYHFLSNAEVTAAKGYQPKWTLWPIPKPNDGLVVSLSSSARSRH